MRQNRIREEKWIKGDYVFYYFVFIHVFILFASLRWIYVWTNLSPGNFLLILIICSSYVLHKRQALEYRTEHCFEGKQTQVSHNIFISQSIHNLVLCVFLYKDTLLHIFCWFINTELTANSLCNSDLNETHLTNVFFSFSERHITALLT